MSECTRVRFRAGDPLGFVATPASGLDPRYTRAVFVARADWLPSAPLLLHASTDAGDIEIDHAAGSIKVRVSPASTSALATSNAPRVLAAQVRVSNPADPEDCWSFRVPLEVLPEVGP